MKSLSLAKPLVIMMVGLPGAGKSFFAKQFSDTFGAPLVSFDRLRHELFTDPQFSPDENDIIARVAQYQFEELLKTARTFICDGGCNTRVARNNITQLARKAGYDTLTIWVQTDTGTCHLRATKRNAKRADDQYNANLSTEEFQKQAKILTPPVREPALVISGKHTYATQARVVLKRLVGGREEQAQLAHKQELPPERSAPPRSNARHSVTIR